MDCNVDKLNPRQKYAYGTIFSSAINHKRTTFFLNGGAGTRKTFLYNTVVTKCRSIGNTVVAVASYGIASLLLVEVERLIQHLRFRLMSWKIPHVVSINNLNMLNYLERPN